MLHIGSSRPITGDARHQKTLLRAAGGLGPLGPATVRRQLVVQLEREAEKRHGPAAIRIAFNGETVGHVPTARIDDYRSLLDWAASVGYEVVCRAHLVGGYARGNGTSATVGIYLNHSSPPVVQFHGPLPSLTDPNPDWWGDWGDIEVKGEGHHQDFLAEHRFRTNIASLVIGEHGLVHVEIDGTRVGHLTSKMSDRYRPGVARQSTDGRPVTVFCKVKIGPHKLDVTVKLPEREALDAWQMGL